MKRSLFAILLVAASASALAQMSPAGLWKTIDDETKVEKSYVRIVDSGGVLTGRIEKLLRPGADPHGVCDRCTDDRKDKPMVGLEIIRGAKKTEGKDVWEGGRILDPEKGSTYALRLTPIEGGAKLEVRGSVLGIGRTQTWVRAQ